MAQENEYVSSAAETMFESSQDHSMRIFMEGVEEAARIRRGQEIRLERAEAALQARTLELEEKEATIQKMDAALQEKDTALQEKDAEIARLTALLANK